MAGRAGRRAADMNDERPPEPPPPPPGVSQRSRHSSEGGRGRSEHNIPDEGLGGIVAPIRAKVPRESSPTPATRLPGGKEGPGGRGGPGGRDSRADRSPSPGRPGASPGRPSSPGRAGRGGRPGSPRRQNSEGNSRSVRPPPPPPSAPSKASKAPPPPPSGGSDQRSKSPPRPQSPPPRPAQSADQSRAKTPPAPPPIAGEPDRERSRSPSRDERRAPRDQRGSPNNYAGSQPNSLANGTATTKGPPGKASPPAPAKRTSSLDERLKRSSPTQASKLKTELPLLAGDLAPLDPEETATDSGFYQETTTDDGRSWGNYRDRASLQGSVASPTEAATSVTSPSPPIGRGFDFGMMPKFGPSFPGMPGFIPGVPPIGSANLVPPMMIAAGRGAPRALVPPLPLGSALDLSQVGLHMPAMRSPTAEVPPFPLHSMPSVDSSALSMPPSTPMSQMRTPSIEFRALPVPAPFGLVQLAAPPTWRPASPGVATRSARSRSGSPMRSPMRTDERANLGPSGMDSTPPNYKLDGAAQGEQREVASKAPVAIPLATTSFKSLRMRSMSPRPMLGPPRNSRSPLQVRSPVVLPLGLASTHPRMVRQRSLSWEALKANAGLAPTPPKRGMIPGSRSVSPGSRSVSPVRTLQWTSPVSGNGVARIGSPLRSGALSPPRSSSIPRSPSGMVPYAGAGVRQNIYASVGNLRDVSAVQSRSSQQKLSAEAVTALASDQELSADAVTTAYPRSPTGSPRWEEPLRPPIVKARSIQQAEQDFMRRWRDWSVTEGKDVQEAMEDLPAIAGAAAYAGPSPEAEAFSPSQRKAAPPSSADRTAVAALTDNVLEAAGKRRDARQRVRPPGSTKKRVGQIR